MLEHGSPGTTINSLPDELFIEIFDWRRLDDEYRWSYRRQWYIPLQVCQRWRYIMLESISHLRLGVLCNLANPIPLILSFNFRRDSPHSKQQLPLALQHHNRVGAITVHHWYLESLGLSSPFANAFPMLETLSLSSGYFQPPRTWVLPDNFVAPRLRALHLRNVAISTRSLLLASASTNLLSLCLELIPELGYLPPEYLAEQFASMPRLENISLKSIAYPSFPRTARELSHPQFTRVVLSQLSRLIYVGISLYLDDLLSRISTPILQDFRFESDTEENPDALCLSAFLCEIQNLDLRSVMVSFTPSLGFIKYRSGQALVAPPYLDFEIGYTSQHHAVTQVAQICSAVAPALSSVVENLEIQLNFDYDDDFDSGFFAQHAHWHAFLRLFEGVKTLRVDMNLTAELSNALGQNNGVVIEELLPVLSELDVVMRMFRFRMDVVDEPFSSFIHARRLSGHSIDLRVIQGHYSRLPSPPISWSFDTFDL
jgi:hypothetical protein